MEISYWFKNSLLGIITLGTIGSIVAIIVLNIFKKFIFHFIPDKWEIYRKYRLKSFFTSGYIGGYLSGSKDIFGMLVYYSYRIAKFIFFVFICILLTITFFQMLTIEGGIVINLSNYLILVLALLFLISAVNQFRTFIFEHFFNY